LSAPVKFEARFQPQFREDLRSWVEIDRRVALRILDLIEAILRDPFTGIGKPEPLKYVLTNTCSLDAGRAASLKNTGWYIAWPAIESTPCRQNTTTDINRD
jgi:YoeB-like toxin of bacterial type II toxin-antitoxin system